jgi:hypothetical protein
VSIDKNILRFEGGEAVEGLVWLPGDQRKSRVEERSTYIKE